MMVAVIGSNGLLGRRFCEYFAKNEMSFLSTQKSDLDIANEAQVANFFLNHKTITHVVLCAAYTNVDQAETDKDACFKVNVDGVQNIINHFDGVLIHFSTDFVFDGFKRDGYEVHDERNPINVYGASKKAAEDVLTASLGKQWANIRISSLVDENACFVQFLKQSIKQKKAISLWSTNKMIPTVSVELVAEVVKKFVLQNFETGHYHLPSKNFLPMSWYELACHLFPEHTDLFAPVDEFKTVAQRPKFSVLLRD